VPTVGESGGPKDFEVTGANVIVAPPGLPAATTGESGRAVQQALAGAEMREKFKSFSYEPFVATRAQLQQILKTEARRFGEVIRRAKISID
jgi:tripartite-type tricarboxylate transporter receptor subunit TctC